ncbi:2-C-methyl-D-erythritol 4-phosphate cytidylyltransferase [Anatilimnocola floriformis]|uniref:2-C-methyl-D-erythritol 4-phosphate cytidylyltransferase n=1 Tax=Anatilimnocola floriformis TaxID=2948575 RepID=UPI0020C480E7|nr:2-C-methyl-D-erythritol 4-phosphate cytidylyltransferase [Anatilimnocola floriformis]
MRVRPTKYFDITVAKFAVILPAAGKSSRFSTGSTQVGDIFFKKPFAPLENRPVWMHAADKFVNRPDVKQTLIVISREDLDDFTEKFGGNCAMLGIEIVAGGAERSDSVQAALARIKPEIDFVAVHDAARPCLTDEWIDKVFERAEQTGAAMLAVPVAATLKRVGPDKNIQETVSRESLWEAQTPQVFRRQLLLDAYAHRGDFTATDDAQLVERLPHPVAVVQCSAMNIKITSKDDLRLASAILKALPKPKLLNPPAHPFADDHLWR